MRAPANDVSAIYPFAHTLGRRLGSDMDDPPARYGKRYGFWSVRIVSASKKECIDLDDNRIDGGS